MELIRLGAYRVGSSAEVDQAFGLYPALSNSPPKVRKKQPISGQGHQRLEQILARAETEN